MGYFSHADGFKTTLSEAYWYATGIVLATFITTVTLHPFNFYMSKMSTKVRLGCSGLIYQKTLRLMKSSNENSQTGKIINLLSNDLHKFGSGLECLHDIWKGPLEAIAFFIIIYVEIGFAAVIGVGFLLSFIPVQCKLFLLKIEFTNVHNSFHF